MQLIFPVSSPDGKPALLFFDRPPWRHFHPQGRDCLVLCPAVRADFSARAYRGGREVPLSASDGAVLAAFFFRDCGLPSVPLRVRNRGRIFVLTDAGCAVRTAEFSCAGK